MISAPSLAAVLGAAAGAAWAAAGAALLRQAHRERSHPDYLFAVGLLCGGVLLGLDMAAAAGDGPFPLPGLTLAMAALLAIGFGGADSANALLPADRPRLWLAGLGAAAALHALHAWLGMQPTIGPGLRPFELPLAVLLALQARTAFRLPEGFLAGLTGTQLTAMLAAAALASAISASGLGPADELSAACLLFGPFPYLLGQARAGDRAVPLAGAAATAAALVCLLRAQVLRMEDDLLEHGELRAAAAALQHHAEDLRAPLDEAVASWASNQPRSQFDALVPAFAERFARLQQAATAVPGAETPVAACAQALADQARLASGLFEAVAQRESLWSETELRDRAEERARTLHREAQLALVQMNRALASLWRAEADAAKDFAARIARHGEGLLFVLATVMLLGAGLLHRLRGPGTAAPWDFELETDPEAGPDLLPPLPMSGRVLLVEDQPDPRAPIGQTLRRLGAEVTLAEDGERALRLLENDRFDVVLIDLQLAGGDGLETARRLRERNDRTPVVALTGEGTDAERERCLAAGCNSHIRKPVDGAALEATLATYLGARHA